MIIKNTLVLEDSETLLENKSIVIDDDTIVQVCDFNDIAEEYKSEEIIDGSGKLFMPGLVDSHIHVGQQLLKGMVLDAKPIIWKRIMLPFESTLSPDTMKLMAELCALEMIKSGSLAFVDAGSYYMEEACKVFQKSGLLGLVTCSTMDNPDLPKSIKTTADEAIRINDKLFDEYNDDRIKIAYSIRAMNDCSDELISKVFDHAKQRNTYVISHMNEYQAEIDGIIKRTGKRPYEYLDSLGYLYDKFIGAHSLILSEEEKEIISRNNISICHCPFSNSGKAVADTPELLEMGINIGLGTDGAAHGGLSLWNEMKIFRCLMNIYHGVPNKIYNIMPAETLIKMATANGYKLIGENAGEIKTGKKANIIGININTPILFPSGNFIHTLVESTNAENVTDMIIRGKFVMKDRAVLTLNEEEILEKARKHKLKCY